ncbi:MULTISPECIES: LysR family transcriptional regulator [unclassified Pseudomonas]|uniref:LysR family transcriptional regulator n=1 Tax=unclassified Pseudomonas TaxID=196821 RepID=UPI000D386A3A|nr:MULTISPECIES: LysR family transcriptional regulator [unclassified Pseudomonas]RAU40342.1 LysR family transcriptional regulator [Pseudomonas sp. RIT 409]RAU55501.1 LysR family transcriptional regulator [Pseudomonas sp. RIT 412]
MSRLPDFEGLAMFAKVAEEGSFAAAARVMGVSVPTVSRAVARLEERLGGRLFNRTSRQLALTEFGSSMVAKASDIYRQAEELESEAQDLSVQPRGQVRLAVPMAFGLRWVAPLLPKLLRQYPEITVDLHLSDASVDLIADGFDAALRIAVMPDSSLVARRLCAVRQLAVASPGYLAEHGHPSHPRELASRTCLSYAYRARSQVWRFTHTDGSEEDVMPTGPLRVTNSDALIPVLLEGLAIAEMPEFIASEYLADGRLEVLLPDWSMARGGLFFVTPSARSRPAKIRALSDFFALHLSEPQWRWPPVQS